MRKKAFLLMLFAFDALFPVCACSDAKKSNEDALSDSPATAAVVQVSAQRQSVGTKNPLSESSAGAGGVLKVRESEQKNDRDDDWYDPSSLLVSLSGEIRSQLQSVAGVNRLNELPLYELKIDLNSRARTYMLHETIWYTNRENGSQSEIVFRLYANTEGTYAPKKNNPVRLLGGHCATPRQCTVVSKSPSTISVALEEPLLPGGRVRINLDLMGRLQVIEAGRTNIFAQGIEGMASMMTHGAGGDYGLLAIGDGIVSLANFYAVLASRRDGAWVRQNKSTMGDLGSDDLANVRAAVTLDREMIVVSTGVPLSTDKALSAKQKQVEVGAALVRDFTLLASPDFEIAKQTVQGIDVSSYFLRVDRVKGQEVLEAAAVSLQTYINRFGSYPYVSLDVVEAALVGGAGGVEFPGLVTVASMFYRPFNESSGPMANLLQRAGQRASMLQDYFDSMLEFVTAHEVAHQYWHVLVGSDSRNDPFGDEGLAQFSAVLYVEERWGQERAKKALDMQVLLGYKMMRMQGIPDDIVAQPVYRFNTPLAYGGLVYGKGPMVYPELRRILGDALFFATLREYVLRYRFRVAPEQGFIEMLAQKDHRVSPIAHRWLKEKHGDEDIGSADMSEMFNMLGLGGSLGQMGNQLLQDMLQPGGKGSSKELQDLLKDLESLSAPTQKQPTEAELKELQDILGLPED